MQQRAAFIGPVETHSRVVPRDRHLNYRTKLCYETGPRSLVVNRELSQRVDENSDRLRVLVGGTSTTKKREYLGASETRPTARRPASQPMRFERSRRQRTPASPRRHVGLTTPPQSRNSPHRGIDPQMACAFLGAAAPRYRNDQPRKQIHQRPPKSSRPSSQPSHRRFRSSTGRPCRPPNASYTQPSLTTTTRSCHALETPRYSGRYLDDVGLTVTGRPPPKRSIISPAHSLHVDECLIASVPCWIQPSPRSPQLWTSTFAAPDTK